MTDLKTQLENLDKGMKTALKLLKELLADEEFYESKATLSVDEESDYYYDQGEDEIQRLMTTNALDEEFIHEESD